MNREEIIKLALEAGDDFENTLREDQEFLIRFLRKLVEAVQALEREACAQIGDGYDYGDRNCGDEIRARGMK